MSYSDDFCILNKESLPELSNSILLFSSPSLPPFFTRSRGRDRVLRFFGKKGSFFFLLLLLLFFGRKGGKRRGGRREERFRRKCLRKRAEIDPGDGGDKFDGYENIPDLPNMCTINKSLLGGSA